MTQQKHTLNTNLETLMHAQAILDLHIELGADPQELKKEINVEITKLSAEIHLYHYNVEAMLNERLPMMQLWCEALDQLNWFIRVCGKQEAGVIGLNYIRLAWGLELDLEQGNYNMSNDQMIVPFLNKLVKDVGPLDILDLRHFLELYWGADRVEEIIVEFMYKEDELEILFEDDDDAPIGLAIDFEVDEEDTIPVEIEVFHLAVNEVVLREIHWSAANEVMLAVQKLEYQGTEHEDIVQIRKGMDVNIAIKLECERLKPELQGVFIDAFLQ